MYTDVNVNTNECFLKLMYGINALLLKDICKGKQENVYDQNEYRLAMIV